MNSGSIFLLGMILAIFGAIGALYSAIDDENALGSPTPKRWMAAAGFAIMAAVLWFAPWPGIDAVALWGWRFVLVCITAALMLPEIRKVLKFLADHSYPVG